jgi:hypothetical protein
MHNQPHVTMHTDATPAAYTPVLHRLPEGHGPILSLEDQRECCEARQPQAVAEQLIQ